MDNMKLVRAKAAAISSICVLMKHDRDALMHLLTFVKDKLVEEESMAVRAMFEANEAIRKAQYGKA
jgi:hypothetical protein